MQCICLEIVWFHQWKSSHTFYCTVWHWKLFLFSVWSVVFVIYRFLPECVAGSETNRDVIVISCSDTPATYRITIYLCLYLYHHPFIYQENCLLYLRKYQLLLMSNEPLKFVPYTVWPHLIYSSLGLCAFSPWEKPWFLMRRMSMTYKSEVPHPQNHCRKTLLL